MLYTKWNAQDFFCGNSKISGKHIITMDSLYTGRLRYVDSIPVAQRIFYAALLQPSSSVRGLTTLPYFFPRPIYPPRYCTHPLHMKNRIRAISQVSTTHRVHVLLPDASGGGVDGGGPHLQPPCFLHSGVFRPKKFFQKRPCQVFAPLHGEDAKRVAVVGFVVRPGHPARAWTHLKQRK